METVELNMMPLQGKTSFLALRTHFLGLWYEDFTEVFKRVLSHEDKIILCRKID